MEYMKTLPYTFELNNIAMMIAHGQLYYAKHALEMMAPYYNELDDAQRAAYDAHVARVAAEERR